MITDPSFALTLGDLDLLGYEDDPAGWWIKASGEDVDFGDPTPVEKTILSFLIDGSTETIESFDNREMTLKLAVWATSSANLALAEAALAAEVAKRNVLTWTPPEEPPFEGVPCVFDVVTSNPTFQFSEVYERNLIRVYTLNIKALPFPKSDTQAQVTNEAPPSTTPSVTTVDDCESLTGWNNTGFSGTAPALVTGPSFSGNGIRTAYTNSGTTTITRTCGLNRTGLAVSMSGTPYLRVHFPSFGYGGVGFTQTVKINGVVVEEADRNGEIAWFEMPAGATTLTSFTVQRTASIPKGKYVSLVVADISRSDMHQDTTGARQRSFSFPVEGSARTQGSLSVEDPSAALGTVLVYTSSSATSLQQPPLRALRTAGPAETTDTTLVSGKYSDLSTNHVFQIPSTNLAPGGYVLLARVKHASTSSYNLTWAAKSVMGTTTVESSQSGTQSVALSAGVWKVATVGRMILPSAVMGSSGLTQIELSGPSGVLMDEAWLFNLDTGRLIQVDCGIASPSSGGSANRLFIDAPSLDAPAPSITVGTDAGRIDAFNPGAAIQSFGQPVMVPPAMSVFVVTTDAVAADVTLTYWPRFWFHVYRAAA